MINNLPAAAAANPPDESMQYRLRAHDVLVTIFFGWENNSVVFVVIIFRRSRRGMLIDFIIDNEKVNPVLLCNRQWSSQKNTAITRTPNVGV
jgi:hypothetical protein